MNSNTSKISVRGSLCRSGVNLTLGVSRLETVGLTPNLHKKRGFTLIELLVVVLIIGILAAVAVPQYQKAVWKARAVEYLTVINVTQKALAAYILEHREEDKTFLDTAHNVDNLSELDLEIPISNKLKTEAESLSISVDHTYGGNIQIFTSSMELSYDLNMAEGYCDAYENEGIVICNYLSTHLSGLSCVNKISGDVSCS